ncbi:MAG: glycosyltransferase [Thermoanaerobaculia bacterium]
MQLLWIATKSPWPPRDGGRLLLLETLGALTGVNARIVLVAPCAERGAARLEIDARLRELARPVLMPARRRSRVTSLLRSLAGGDPFGLARHRSGAVRAAVERELEGGAFDAVVVEQLQAWPQAGPARRRGLPVVLRAQNVESDLWCALAASRSGIAATVAAREARRLARAEGEAVAAAAWTVTLTASDATRLVALAGGRGRVACLPPPFASCREASGSALTGEPALVLFSSAGWEPNAEGERWFVDSVWPAILRARPAARLHLFGSAAGAPRRAPAPIVAHPRPASSASAFAPGSILIVPLRTAIGLRMRILEAWARGMPVISTPEGAAGLGAEDGRELLLASDASEFVRAVARLAEERDLAPRLVAAGSERLAREHSPERFAHAFRDGLAAALEAGR